MFVSDVIPAEAGIHAKIIRIGLIDWIPSFEGMTLVNTLTR